MFTKICIFTIVTLENTPFGVHSLKLNHRKTSISSFILRFSDLPACGADSGLSESSLSLSTIRAFFVGCLLSLSESESESASRDRLLDCVLSFLV